MSIIATPERPSSTWSATEWLVPAGLLALAFIPVTAGVFRVTMLASHAPLTPANVRFFASPVPVALHIFSVTIFSILGAFQFSTPLRRRWPGWHRAAGRILVAAGMLAALSGLWMAMFYAIVPADNALLHAFRLFFGVAMATSILLGLLSIRGGNVPEHQAWMRRAYAIGMGAGTQGLIQIPHEIILGKPDAMTLSLLMGAAWVLNLSVAEWFIRRDRARRTRRIRSR